jgi:hypothetical protein
MFVSTIVSLVRFFCLGFSHPARALNRLLTWFRQTSPRMLCRQCLSVMLVAGASLLLLGNNSCEEENTELYADTMGHVYNIFPLHYVPKTADRPVHSNAVHPRLTGTDGSSTGTADFQGNFTAIRGPAQGTMVMVREADCSLGLVTVASETDPGTVIQHYEQTLHQLASLNTTADVFAKGCPETSIGINARPGVFVGETVNQVLVFAAAGPNQSNNAVFLFNSNNTLTQSTVTSVPYATLLATGDLNGDQNNDLVVVNGGTSGGATISVMLANADGTFQSPVVYNVAGAASGNGQFTATIDDVNGDGNLDVITVSADQQISVLLGKGDGTFDSPQSFTAPAVPGTAQTVINNIITADVNGDGKKDLICSNGLVLLGNGNGTFTAASAAAFPYLLATSSEGPNLAAGDVNNDGKVDLVVNNGQAVFVYLGNGNGTFTAGTGYSSVNDTGFVTITDLDGDGNPDIYVGLADNGIYSGDDSNAVLAYALMGNGDGTFQGAPLAPGAYDGNNLVDVNGDGYPDLVSNASGVYGNTGISGTFTVALGSASGKFTVKSTIAAPDSFSLSGYTFSNANTAGASSYAVADVNGDGKPDLVFVDNNLTATTSSGSNISYPLPVYFVALGNGDGTFQAASPYAFPQIAPSGGNDISLTVSSLQIADFNKDGHADLVFTYNDVAGGTGVSNPYLQGFVVLTGNGNGTFSTTAILTSTYASTSAPASALTSTITQAVDINGDGTPDLVATVPGGNASTGFTVGLDVYLGNGDGTFRAPNAINIAANVYGVPVVADLNGDNKLDLAFIAETVAGSGEIGIALGNGDGTFANATTIPLVDGDEVRGDGLAAADFNGDGHLDLLLIDAIDFAGVFYGNGNGTFTSVPLSNGMAPKDLLNIVGGAPAVAAALNSDTKPDALAGNVILFGAAVPATTPPTGSTTTTLKASATAIASGASVTFTATVAPASGSGTPTGTVTFLKGSTTLGTGTLASGTATFSTTSLPVGADSITAVYGGDSSYSSSTSSAVTVTVSATALAPTATTLTASAATVTSGASLTLTAKVAETSGSATPTGTVTFLDGTTTLGTGTLASGTAAYSTTTLSVGAHSLTARYGGDASNAASTSSAVSVTVTAAVTGSFSIGLSPSSGSVNAGSSATTTISVTPSGGFNQQVSFSCSGLPTTASCSFSPATVTPNGSASTTTLTIATNQSAAATPAQLPRSPATTAALAFLGGGALLGWGLRRRRVGSLWYVQLGLGLALLAATGLMGCGGSSNNSSSSSNTTPSSASYQVTVTGTAGSTTETAVYSLTIQ